MTIAWIRKHYRVPARRGGRVEYTGESKPQLGTICGASGSHLSVRLDGIRHSLPFHPTWKLRYLDEAKQQDRSQPMTDSAQRLELAETTTDEEALASLANILQWLANRALDGLHADIDSDVALSEINNLARDAVDALTARRLGSTAALRSSALPETGEQCSYCKGTGRVELTIAERNALDDLEMRDALARVAIRRSWLEDVIKTLQGPLPGGHTGDVVFLLRDQLQYILDRQELALARPQPGGVVTEHGAAVSRPHHAPAETKGDL